MTIQGQATQQHGSAEKQFFSRAYFIYLFYTHEFLKYLIIQGQIIQKHDTAELQFFVKAYPIHPFYIFVKLTKQFQKVDQKSNI